MHILQLTLALLTLLTLTVSAHGFMKWPIPRSLPGDQQNGDTFVRNANNRVIGGTPAYDRGCNYLPPGPVFTQTLKPGDAVVDWWISAFHMGGCVVEISRDGGTTWSYIGGDARGTGHIPVVIPAVSGAGESYKAVIRWYYTANNGGSPDEEFASCSDVVVANNGSNEHTFHVKVPQSPWQYQQTGCEAGALMCSDDSAFINQCISLAKSGTWGGGSAWYAYQCPEGTTCKNNNCVGNPVATSTIVAKPSLTSASSTIAPVTSSLVLSTKASTTIPAVPISTIVAKVSTNAVSSTQVATSIATTTPVSTSLNAIKTAAVSSTSKPTSTVPAYQVTSSSTIVKVYSSTIVKDTSSTVTKASSSTIAKAFSSTIVAKAASSSVATTVGKGTTATTSSASATITKPATGSIKNGDACAVFGEWACNNTVLCSYGTNGLRWYGIASQGC
ncbi:hypothetical protein HDU79_010865 [Rhizoclosmatium sp. JEL0117]|nr:hypothetical protein HDU79_010865 [Rhizoclosmatium sp. JEL0117]